jgi:hypothetical protein
MDNVNVNNLLGLVNSICEKYDEIDKITGEDFNIFETLNLKYKETSHTKIIAGILNRNGCRGNEDKFLKFFLDEVKNNVEKEIKKIEEEFKKESSTDSYRKRYEDLKSFCEYSEKFENARIEAEKTIGNGRVDILITGDNAKIAIENKIDDVNRPGQLEGYREALGPDPWMIYLTPEGKPPKKYKDNLKLISMSYKDSIINWLERCKEKSVNFSYLRETIAQYINLLKDITGQSRRKDMSDEIIGAMLKNVKSAFGIFDAVKDVNELKKRIVLRLFVPAMKDLAERYGMKAHDDPKDCLDDGWGISLHDNDILKENNIAIRFHFLEKNLRKCRYGFCYKELKDLDSKSDLIKYLKGIAISEPWWPFYNEMPKYPNWGNEQLTDLSEIIDLCEEKINELRRYIEAFKKN